MNEIKTINGYALADTTARTAAAGKVSISDIVNDLTTDAADKPLSAAQGMALKRLIDALMVPDRLNEAVEDALEQAKASGEFDGSSVTVASVSESTADGGSNVVTFSDGSTMTVKNGSKGSTGADGYTPIRGTDYWTAADQASMVQQVIAALPDAAEVSY